MNNSIFVIKPYKWNGIWVFDDPNTQLEREAFVAGIDLIIDKLVENIPNADNGFIMLFSTTPFPGYDIFLELIGPDIVGGNWYKCNQYDMEGWLCPALYLYYSEAPSTIYVQAKSI